MNHLVGVRFDQLVKDDRFKVGQSPRTYKVTGMKKMGKGEAARHFLSLLVEETGTAIERELTLESALGYVDLIVSTEQLNIELGGTKS